MVMLSARDVPIVYFTERVYETFKRLLNVCVNMSANNKTQTVLSHDNIIIHRESKKGATLTMAITLSILDRFAKFFHCCKEQ